MTKRAWRITVRSTALTLFILALIVATRCWEAYARDRQTLRDVVRDVVPPNAKSAERVLALLHWVYDLAGTRRNNGYFLVPALRATPAQILRNGGDCADKSRLLAALLHEADVPATMALCFDQVTGAPAHTIVQARVGPDEYMAVDPAFDLFFPKAGEPGYHDLLDLRRDPTLVDRRVEAIQAGAGPESPVRRYYLRSGAAYETAATINWNRNFLLGWIHASLHALYGEAVYRLPRPRLLEEPQLFVAAVALIAAGLAFMVMILSVRSSLRPTLGPAAAPHTAAAAPQLSQT